MNKTNSMPDLEVTPLETSNGQKLSSSIMDFVIKNIYNTNINTNTTTNNNNK